MLVLQTIAEALAVGFVLCLICGVIAAFFD